MHISFQTFLRSARQVIKVKQSNAFKTKFTDNS